MAHVETPPIYGSNIQHVLLYARDNSIFYCGNSEFCSKHLAHLIMAGSHFIDLESLVETSDVAAPKISSEMNLVDILVDDVRKIIFHSGRWVIVKVVCLFAQFLPPTAISFCWSSACTPCFSCGADVSTPTFLVWSGNDNWYDYSSSCSIWCLSWFPLCHVNIYLLVLTTLSTSVSYETKNGFISTLFHMFFIHRHDTLFFFKDPSRLPITAEITALSLPFDPSTRFVRRPTQRPHFHDSILYLWNPWTLLFWMLVMDNTGHRHYPHRNHVSPGSGCHWIQTLVAAAECPMVQH